MKRKLLPSCSPALLERCLLLAATLAACNGDNPQARVSGCTTIGLTSGEVASAVGWPLTASRGVPGDSESCEFGGGARHVQVSVRPAGGRLTVESWIEGRMPLHASAFAGVGDAAIWQPDLHELIAEEGDVLCDVSVTGRAIDSAPSSSRDVARRLANLCRTLFAVASGSDGRAHPSWRDK